MAEKKTAKKPPSPAEIDRRTGVSTTGSASRGGAPPGFEYQYDPLQSKLVLVRVPTTPAKKTTKEPAKETVQPVRAVVPEATVEPVATPAAAPIVEPVAEPVAEPEVAAPQIYQPVPVYSVTPEDAAASPELVSPAPMEQAPAEPTQDQTSAYQLISDALADYGLQELGDFVTKLVFEQGIVTEAGLMTEIRKEDAYKTRFAANINRRARGLTWIDEREYLRLENSMKKVLRDAGMPPGFYDSNDDVDQFIELDVSPDELAERIEFGYDAINRADPEVIDAMRRLYGVGDSELAAYFLDPERAQNVILRQARSAQIAGQAQRQARMEIGVSLAEELETAGVTQEQARQGFGVIRQLGEVFQTTAEEQMGGEQAFGQEEQVGAVFGTSAAAQQRLRQRQRRRTAAFEAGGSFAGQGAEITGLR